MIRKYKKSKKQKNNTCQQNIARHMYILKNKKQKTKNKKQNKKTKERMTIQLYVDRQNSKSRSKSS